MIFLAVGGIVVAWIVASLIVAHALGSAARERDRYMYGDDAPPPHDPSA